MMTMSKQSTRGAFFSIIISLLGLLMSAPDISAFFPHSSLTSKHNNASFRTLPVANQAAKTTTTTTRLQVHQVTIEYCSGCRWGLRGFWTAQELLSTFRDDANLGAVTVIPSDTPGRFAVTAYNGDDDNTSVVLWDRQEVEGFPEMKELKQRVRDEINPERFLGHSDSTSRQEENSESSTEDAVIVDLSKESPAPKDMNLTPGQVQGAPPTPHVTITYCTGCQWLLRAAYTAQELVSTFGDEIHAVSLLPSRRPAKGGAFMVTMDGTTVWDRFEQGRFPETKELKQLIRDIVNPSKDLGHIDGKKSSDTATIQDMDDDEAEEARKFFGVM